MLSSIARGLASISLALKQPLAGYCDVETSHGDALVTKQGDYLSFLRVGGMKRMATRADIERLAAAMRIDLSGTLENKGHAIVGWYLSDPDLAAREIERVNMESCREVASQLGIDLADILDERMRLWSGKMRWEASYLILWTRRAVLTKEEVKQMKEERDLAAKQCPAIGDAQQFFLRSELIAAHHSGFVARVIAALRGLEISAEELSARQSLTVIREGMYRETTASSWRAILVGDRLMPRLPEEDVKRPNKEGLLWPSLRGQLFHADAVTHGGQRVEIGEYEYTSVDIAIGPEDPRPFVELASWLGQDRVPWRGSFILEGGGRAGMTFKEIGASFLSIFPANRDLQRAFAALRHAREQDNHISVKLRASFATWAAVGEARLLRRRASTLSQRIEGWGNCKAVRIAGDPLEGVLSSVPGLSLASTANPALALLGDALAMLPWNHTVSPWERGSVLFRLPNGAIWPYDPSGGSKRPLVIDIFVAPPGSGKSVLANSVNIGLCLSSAVLGGTGAKLPLIGKVDIGSSAEGFVRLIQEALGPERRHEAIYATMQFAPGYEFNVFDLQVGCEYPLPLERAFLQNFLALITLPPDVSTPFEGMAQMIGLVIDEAYRQCTDVPGASPKRYRRGVEPLVDAALDRLQIKLHPEDPIWRDVVTALCAAGEYRLAEIAQRHVVPLLQDLITAARSDQVMDMFQNIKIAVTAEQALQLFERYIYDAIRKYPTLNSPTRLDFGSARIIVLDLQEVAPTGSAASNRQTEMMYLLARHVLARNFFLKPDYLRYVPEPVRAYHARRFQETYETVKRLDYDEWHRTLGSPQVRAQAELDAREGRKHNIQLGFSSQRLSDMGDSLISQSTGRFVLRAGDEKEAEEIITRFNLSEASASVVRNGLHGPGPNGAPFLAILQVENARYEQLLVNTLGPIELWALSTTPGDTALRNRLYDRVGFSEALRRLSKIFPGGSALKEIERRKSERLRGGELDARAEMGVIDQLTDELINGRGIALSLRPCEDEAGGLAIAAQ
ncbi:Intracellular multiplication protein IcmB [Methylocella tundrae]|uniref:Intracellular multiplication protein IcmB n=1 Tax=Methylocella tundrae TaxID=227605 RepID=A0A8B6M182_METTU|nr:ATP-binding protein [Methylocella tundrae]VTZ48787.1 Intracellular multiplication protein IcmB [Methylocella tundrae]